MKRCVTKRCITCGKVSTGIRKDYICQYGCSYCRTLEDSEKEKIECAEKNQTNEKIKGFIHDTIYTNAEYP